MSSLGVGKFGVNDTATPTSRRGTMGCEFCGNSPIQSIRPFVQALHEVSCSAEVDPRVRADPGRWSTEMTICPYRGNARNTTNPQPIKVPVQSGHWAQSATGSAEGGNQVGLDAKRGGVLPLEVLRKESVSRAFRHGYLSELPNIAGAASEGMTISRNSGGRCVAGSVATRRS